MFRNRRDRNYTGVILLLMELYSLGSDYVPPVTLSLVMLQIGIYLDPLGILPQLQNGCMSYMHVVMNGDYSRLLYSPLMHVSDFHLYYNMISFVWKGISLEPYLTSKRFIVVILETLVLCQLIHILSQYVLYEVTGDISYITDCSVGFSGEIFALKAILSIFTSAEHTLGYGIWFELALNQFLLSNVSLLGHLSGILAGILYTKNIFIAIETPIVNFLGSLLSKYNDMTNDDE